METLVKLLYERIKKGDMELSQAPLAYQEELKTLLENGDE